jgi:uncharacterized protein
MTAYLLDVNVLIALSWPGHAFHDTVQTWFARNAAKGWATCPMVQAGFVRIISSPAFSQRAVTPSEALHALESHVRHPAHQFWPDDLSVAKGVEHFRDRIVGHQQITGAYLVALATRRGGKLTTLDKRLAAVFGKSKQEQSHLELIQ